MNGEMSEVVRYTYHCFSSRERDDVVLFLYDAHYNRSAIPQVIDLLRNESPVYLLWGEGRNTALATDYEPVGEGEPA